MEAGVELVRFDGGDLSAWDACFDKVMNMVPFSTQVSDLLESTDVEDSEC